MFAPFFVFAVDSRMPSDVNAGIVVSPWIN